MARMRPGSPTSNFRVLGDYPRRAHLEFYRRYPNPFYSVTFELDATRLRAAIADAGVSTYAAFCWAFHRALLDVEAFRVRLHGDDVVLYDELRLGLTVPAPRRTFSFTDLDWHPDAGVFFPAAASVMARASASSELVGGEAPDFAYYTALPRLPFTGFTHVALPDPLAGQPEIAFGRFAERDARVRLPVGLQVNHVYVDGADLGELYEAAQDSFDRAF
jgi:chloramphenicol O-acetyltransferase type A